MAGTVIFDHGDGPGRRDEGADTAAVMVGSARAPHLGGSSEVSPSNGSAPHAGLAAPDRPAAHRTGRAGLESAVQIVIMLAIGSAAGAASFTHVHAVAVAHGQAGWLAWADAVVLELMSVASGLELRRRRRHLDGVGFPVGVLVCAVVLSLAAQVVQAEPSVIGWVAAALPALGFLVMVKIALGHSPSTGDALVSQVGGSGDKVAGTVPDGVPPVPDGRSTPAGTGSAGPSAPLGGAGPSNPGHAVGRLAGAAELGTGGGEGALSGVRVEELLPAARVAKEALEAEGRSVSREALAGRLRASGHPVSNANASAVLKLLDAPPNTR